MSYVRGAASMGMVAAKGGVSRYLHLGDEASVFHLVVAGEAHLVRHRADARFKALRRRRQSPVRIPPTPVLTETTAFT